MREFSYLVAFKATSMESRIEFNQWLKERNAAHVLADVWLLRSHHPLAGDIRHDIEAIRGFDGQLLVVKLNEATDWTHHDLSAEADAWIRANLRS